MRLELERQRRDVEVNGERIRARCRTLAGFIREAWPILHPAVPYSPNWHIEFICQHLEAVTFGKFLAMGFQNRLLINVPPGAMKSLLVNVFWTVWEWGPCGMPSIQNIATSFRADYCRRDARRIRDLVTSEWYQSLWPNVVLKRQGEMSLENTLRGNYEAIPFGSLTGGRADRVKIDDPHSIETAESDADRERTIMQFRESVPTRLNNPSTAAIVLVMQRLHEKDLSGIALALKLGYIHVRLPMEFEPELRCVTPLGEDPRSFEGELLAPERFSRAVVDRDKKAMTEHAIAGQFQQRPAPRGGSMFKRAWFAGKVVTLDEVPANLPTVRHWDLAASTGKNSAWTAGVKMAKTPDGRFFVLDVIRARLEGDDVRKLIRTTADLDTRRVKISLPQDGGQAGKVQATDYTRVLVGWPLVIERETGSKEVRAEPFAAQCKGGNVFLVEGDWIDAYIAELAAFPSGAYKDQVDATSGAFGQLLQLRRMPVFTKEINQRAAELLARQ